MLLFFQCRKIKSAPQSQETLRFLQTKTRNLGFSICGSDYNLQNNKTTVVICKTTVGKYKVSVGGCNASVGKCKVRVGVYKVNVGKYKTSIGDFKVSVGGCKVSVGEFKISLGGCKVIVGSCKTNVGECNVTVGEFKVRVCTPALNKKTYKTIPKQSDSARHSREGHDEPFGTRNEFQGSLEFFC